MFHQTLIPSRFPSCSGSSSSPFFLHANDAGTAPAPCSSSLPSLSGSAMPSYANHHSPMDGRMDPMKSCGAFPPEETAEDAALVERDGFSVEDLLDLEEFGEPDKDGVDAEDAPPPPPAATPAAAEATEAKKLSPGDSQPSSVVSFELPPPPATMVDLPAHDVEEELEWVSRIMDDSLSELPPTPQHLAMAAAAQAARPPLAHHQRRPYDGAYRALPPAPGPVRTPTICALSTEALVPVKAKRSKRSRSSALPVSGAPLFSDSASSSSTATTSSCSSSGASFSPYFLMDAPPFGSPDLDGYRHFMAPQPKKSKHGKGGGKHGKPKKRGRKPKNGPQLAGAAAASAASSLGQGDRRCSHCGVQKTPQWRAGPEGAKSLCNACGVRYKSGRLLPEYRPACSPTFVSSIHSNSHRKVLEMRRKKEAGMLATAAPAVASF